MTDSISLTLSPDEVEMLVDALEADLEGYVEAAKEAREDGNKEDLETFAEAATRIQGLLTRLQNLVEG
jgi:Xaa-Pro aminopeptidase